MEVDREEDVCALQIAGTYAVVSRVDREERLAGRKIN
jgi:hypothetical protein